MMTSDLALRMFGVPETEKYMVVWDVPPELEIGALPKKIYCNRAMVEPQAKAFKNLITSGYVKELRTWDGCFNIRQKKGNHSPSLHCWGLAIDLNAAWNGFGRPTTLSAGFVYCFKTAGFEWGGDWNTKDGMHFQLSEKMVLEYYAKAGGTLSH